MADQLKFELVSPERLVMSQNVDGVVVPGSAGDFTVLAHHQPMMSTIRPGIVEVMGSGVDTPKLMVFGGFAEVTPAGLTILAEKAEPLDAVDGKRMDEEIDALRTRMEEEPDLDPRLNLLDDLNALQSLRARFN